jgi:hypothetical protein
MKEVEATGTKLREDFLSASESADKAKKNTSGAVADADAIAGSFNKAEGSTAKIKETLSTSAKLMKDITDAQAKDSVDKGGRLQKQAQNQIQRGDFEGARKTAEKIAQNEVDASIRGTGKNMDRRSMAEIGKDFGLRQQLGESGKDFTSRIKDVREGRAVADKFGDSTKLPDRPGQDGAKTAPGETSGTATKGGLEGMVDAIKILLEKIEPRLPVAALTA